MIVDRINLLQFSNDLLAGNFGLFYLCFYGVLFTISYLQLWLTMKYVRSFDQPIIKFEKFSAENILDPIVNAMFRISSGDLQGPGTTKLLVSQKVNDYLLVFEKLVNLFKKQKTGIAMRPNIVSKDKMPLILLNVTRRNGKPERYINEVTSFLQGALVTRCIGTYKDQTVQRRELYELCRVQAGQPNELRVQLHRPGSARGQRRKVVLLQRRLAGEVLAVALRVHPARRPALRLHQVQPGSEGKLY